MKKLIAILVMVAMSGCASIRAQMIEDDNAYKRLSLPYASYRCAAYLMGVPLPGDEPTVDYVEGMWYGDYGEKVQGEYHSDTNTIRVRITYRTAQVLLHEMVHAIQFQRGEAYNEWEARKTMQWIDDCIIYADM